MIGCIFLFIILFPISVSTQLLPTPYNQGVGEPLIFVLSFVYLNLSCNSLKLRYHIYKVLPFHIFTACHNRIFMFLVDTLSSSYIQYYIYVIITLGFYKNKHNIDIIHKATPVCLQVINIIMEQWI